MARLAGTFKIAEVWETMECHCERVGDEVMPEADPPLADNPGDGRDRHAPTRASGLAMTLGPETIGQFILDHTNAARKVRFGYSVYDLGGGAKEVQRVRAALTRGAKAQKAWLEEQGRKVRHVTSHDAQLSSVTVERQGLLPEDNGVEVCVLVGRTPSPSQSPVAEYTDGRPSNLQQQHSRGGAVITLARTLAVQPFQEWSKRDYGRPRRDARSGMLPPKLARVMVNLALSEKHQAPSTKSQTSTNTQTQNIHGLKHLNFEHCLGFGACDLVLQRSTLLDPFCGSGTILTEAMALGVPRIIGTDVSARAVMGAQENVEWAHHRSSRRSGDLQVATDMNDSDGGLKAAPTPTVTIQQCNVRELSRCIRERVDVITTEPYLGPPVVSFRAKRGIPSTGLTGIPRRGLLGMTQELRTLYLAAFREFVKVLAPGGRVVFVVPDYRLRTTDYRPSALDITADVAALGFRRINPFPPSLQNHPVLRNREDLPYARPDQRVERRILVFERA